MTCGETISRLSQLYSSGPATAAEQFHSLFDAPTKEQLTQNASYFGARASKPTYLKVGVENVVLAFADAPGGRNLPSTFSFTSFYLSVPRDWSPSRAPSGP